MRWNEREPGQEPVPRELVLEQRQVAEPDGFQTDGRRSGTTRLAHEAAPLLVMLVVVFDPELVLSAGAARFSTLDVRAIGGDAPEHRVARGDDDFSVCVQVADDPSLRFPS